MINRMLRTLTLVCALSLALANPASAEERCAARDDLPPIVNVRIDNDLFGGQDQGYTSGVSMRLVSPNLTDYIDDGCLPGVLRDVNRYLDAFTPGEAKQQNMVVSLEQAIYTPTDFTRSDLISDDRPYAAALLLTLGYNARNDDELRTTQLVFGILGPSARGKQTQSELHHFRGIERFQGWSNQLRDEPVFRVLHERVRRFTPDSDSIWSWDAFSHWGGSLGNLATYANAGGEIRFGRYLPDDFGSMPLRPAGENTAPTRSRIGPSVFAIHAFISIDARAVLSDIALDGNTFKDSHSVDRRYLVGDIGYGFAMTQGRWKFALARYNRSREFEGQVETPTFGSFTISRTF